MYRSILVPLDGSPFGEHALPLALTIARRSGATLHVAHVHTPLTMAEGESLFLSEHSLDFKVRERERGYLEKVVQRLESVSAVPVCPLLLDGVVADVLCAACKTTA